MTRDSDRIAAAAGRLEITQRGRVVDVRAARAAPAPPGATGRLTCIQ
jgi:hypothetical protein